LIEQTTLDGPAPSLHPHYRSFITTTNRSASTPRVGTQHLTVSAAWCSPSHHPKPCGRRYRDLPSHVPCSSRRSGSRRLYAGHHLASKRAPARLIPRFARDLGFDVILVYYDTSNSDRLPDPYLTHQVRLFPHRSPRQSSANAACGRFETTPRRAIPKGHTFISRAVPHHEALPTSSSPPLSGHNWQYTIRVLSGCNRSPTCSIRAPIAASTLRACRWLTQCTTASSE
jgi:hypothetical protein